MCYITLNPSNNMIEDNNQFEYKLQNQRLQIVAKEKDIGVIIDDQLNFESHMSAKINKATSMFGLIRRSFQCLDRKTFVSLYKTLVRTHLDYASSVWAPYKIKHIEMLENVQRRCTRQLPYLKDMSYEERLRTLKLPTLSYRRLRGDMIEVYKIIKGVYDKEVASFLKMWSDVVQRDAGRGHDIKIYLQRGTKSLRQKAFGLRTVTIWNNLPEEVVNATSVNMFKRRLDKHWENQEIRYNYRTSLITGTDIGRKDQQQQQQIEKQRSYTTNSNITERPA